MNRRIIAILAAALAVGSPAALRADPPAQLPDTVPPAPLPPLPATPPPPTLAPPTVELMPSVPEAPLPAAPPPALLPPTVAVTRVQPAGPRRRLRDLTSPPSATPPPPDTHCGPPDLYWVNAGYLYYQFKAAPRGATAVVATAPDGTRTLLGATNADLGWASGLTAGGGFWLNERHTFGVGFGGFLTGRQSSSNDIAAAATDTLTRPFVNALTGANAQLFIAMPGLLTGAYRVESTAQLAGAEAYFLRNLAHEKAFTLDLLFGFRYLDLDETLRMTQRTTPVGPGFILLGGVTYPAGTPLTLTDRFRTRNQFYGGEVGVNAEWRVGPTFLTLAPKVGFGPVHQTVEAAGESTVPGVTLPGGFFALPGGNAGRSGANRFAVLTDLHADLGVYLTSRARVSVGYDLLYLNDVARPGGQIDQVVSPRLVPTARAFGNLSGVASPVPVAGQTDFIAHGLRVVLELRY